MTSAFLCGNWPLVAVLVIISDEGLDADWQKKYIRIVTEMEITPV
jgi:hypothetical protein